MAFELEHDWQGNLATPRARIGENVKARLLIVLCALWIFMGLGFHQPWKPDESLSISIVKNMVEGSSLLAPIAVGKTAIESPPLYYWTAAGLAKLLSPIIAVHDAARLANAFWMSITLLMVGMIGRELWGRGVGRQTTFVFIGSLGLIVTAHMLMPEVASLCGCAMGLYALALAKRRPFRASVLLGTGIGISFLAGGLLYAAIILLSAITLPLIFSNWRSKSFAIVFSLSVVAALPWIGAWPILLWYKHPDLWLQWWHSSTTAFDQANYWYCIRTLAWSSWPALPIALWGLWRYRNYLLDKPKFQLLIVFFLISLGLISTGAEDREIYSLPMLLPLAALAGGSVETLKRGAAGLLNWFGLILFGVMSFLIWLGWFAMVTGSPAKLAKRMQILSASLEGHFNLIAFALAVLITLTWLLVILNAKRSNRAAVTDWAVGISMTWTLLMTLWLPWIDSAKSYEKVLLSLQKSMPANYECINSQNFGESQVALLDYYTNLRVQPLEMGHRLSCDLYLIQDERGRQKIEPGKNWKLIWHGKRPADRRESFRLYKQIK